MTDKQYLPHYIAEKAKTLEAAGIESAKAELEWILCHILDVDRLNLYLHGSELLTDDACEHVDRILVRRATREPLQFILEESWFYGRKFFVTPSVMAPTPETEGLCEAAIKFAATHGIDSPRVLDIGTGSGVIAITMASEVKTSSVLAVDVSEDALEVAQENGRALEVQDRVSFRQSDFLSEVSDDEQFDLILSNPPYIREIDYADLPPEVKADPKIAMTSGDDGLNAVQVILRDAPGHLASGGRIMFEIGMGQSEPIAELVMADGRFNSFTCLKDLNDIDRIIILGCEG